MNEKLSVVRVHELSHLPMTIMTAITKEFRETNENQYYNNKN